VSTVYIMATSSSQVSDYSPHLKRVLKNYQNAAGNSLHGPGPNHYLVQQPTPGPQDPGTQFEKAAAHAQAINNHNKHLADIAYIDHGYSKQQLYREGGFKKALIYSEDCSKSKLEDNCSQCIDKDNVELFRRPNSSGSGKLGELVKVVLPQDLWNRNYAGQPTLPPAATCKTTQPGPGGITAVVALTCPQPPPSVVAAVKTAAAAAASSSCGVPGSSGSAPTELPSSSHGFSQIQQAAQQAQAALEGNGSWVEPGHFLAPPPFPPQPWPVFIAADKQGHGGQSETLLDGEPIACFTVGGEKRLCLPQILNSVLRDFSLTQINAICSDLQIFCSRCTADQLDELKAAAVLPTSAMSCGLITNTDAQRLTQTLLQTHPEAQARLPSTPKPKTQVAVYHCCFGKCKGVLWEDLYLGPGVPCVECEECHGMFSPERFVSHAHQNLEKRTCHWGFEADNWRTYLLLFKEQPMPMEKAEAILKLFKNKFDPSNHKRKKDGVEAELPKKVRGEDGNLAAATVSAAPLGVPAYSSYDPLVQQYYYRLATSTMPPPWTATPLLTRDGKALPPPPPAFVRDSFPAPVPSYLSQGPPVLVDPARVVSMSDSKKFERHYQPNVALAPPKVRDKMTREALSRDSQIEKQALYQSLVVESDNIKKEGCSISYPSGHIQSLSKTPQQKALQRPPSPNIKKDSGEGLPPPNMSAADIHLTNSSRKLYNPEHPELELSSTDSDTDSVSSVTQKNEAVEEAEALLRGWSDRAAASKVAQLVADLAARLAQRETEANMLKHRLDAHKREQNQNMAHPQTQLSLGTRTNKEERQLREKVSVLEAELHSLKEEFRGPMKQPSVIAAPYAATIKTEPCEMGTIDSSC